MTVNSMLPQYKNEVGKITKDELEASRIISLMQKAFSDGAVSIIQANASKSKSPIEAVKNLNENVSDYYVDKNLEALYEYFLRIIDNVTKDGKLIFSYEILVKEDFKNIIKAIYDMGLIAGVQIAQDPAQLKVFLENKEKIESGKY